MERCYRASADIRLDALEHNMKEIRSKIDPQTGLMCVIKTNAYGHGAVVLARELLKMGANAFAVATVEEGIELRKSGITEPILILGFTSKNQYADVVAYDIMPTIFSYAMAKDLDAAARKVGKKASIHIKIDTGMSRIGFKVEEKTIREIVMISHLRNSLNIHGIFTHFSCADCDDPAFTQEQYRKFRYICDSVEAAGVHIPVKHCANSAAIARFPEFQQAGINMVRAGIILYGLYPSDVITPDMIDLKPVMQLKSHVVHIKKLEAGTPIGYGATYVTPDTKKIATVSIGYGDGYPRAMSNKGRVLIGSQYFPIVGRVCMDQLMVDITDEKTEIRVGDEVVLVGKQGSHQIPVEEVADQSASFNYEFVCDINRRVPRVYTRGDEVVEIVNYLV